MGLDYSYVSVRKKFDGFYVSQTTCKDADKQTAEKATAETKVPTGLIYLRVSVQQDAVCNFSFSTDGEKFIPIGEPFKARQGRWIGAKEEYSPSLPTHAQRWAMPTFDWFRIH